MDDFERKLSELHDRVIGNALSDEERANYSESLFDSIKHKNKSGEEFWYARELQIALEYTEWRNFSKSNAPKPLVKTAEILYLTILLSSTKS